MQCCSCLETGYSRCLHIVFMLFHVGDRPSMCIYYDCRDHLLFLPYLHFFSLSSCVFSPLSSIYRFWESTVKVWIVHLANWFLKMAVWVRSHLMTINIIFNFILTQQNYWTTYVIPQKLWYPISSYFIVISI